MIVFVNHHEKEIVQSSNITELIEELALSSKGIAIAINNQVVPKSTWENTAIEAGMHITIIKATQGG